MDTLRSDAGGILLARLFAFRTAAFRFANNVGFPSLSPGYRLSTPIYYFGVLSHGIRPCSTLFGTSIAGFARGFLY